MAAKTLVGFYTKNNIGRYVTRDDIMGGINVINRGEPTDIKRTRVVKYRRYLNELTKDGGKLIRDAQAEVLKQEEAPLANDASHTSMYEDTSQTASIPVSPPTEEPEVMEIESSVSNSTVAPVSNVVEDPAPTPTRRVEAPVEAPRAPQAIPTEVVANLNSKALEELLNKGNSENNALLAAVLAELKKINSNVEKPIESVYLG